MSAHTTLPWQVLPPYYVEINTLHAPPRTVAVATSVADAQFIVRAVNAHDDLLAACKAAENWLGEFIDQSLHDDPLAEGEVRLLQDLRAAIAKTEGTQP